MNVFFFFLCDCIKISDGAWYNRDLNQNIFDHFSKMIWHVKKNVTHFVKYSSYPNVDQF